MVPVFKNVRERSTTKNYHPVSLLSVVSKIFEELVNNRFIDHLEKCGVYSDFQYDFRSSRSTADPLTVASDRIARVLMDLRLLEPWHLIYQGFRQGVSCWSSSQAQNLFFGVISPFLSKKWLRVILDGTSPEVYPLNV